MKPQLSKWLVAPEPVPEQEPARADRAPCATGARDRIERDRLRAGDLEIEFQVVLQVLADAGQIVHHRMPVRRSSSAGPMPESFRSCGELIGPARRITSRRAAPAPRPRTRPAGSARPTARRPSNDDARRERVRA